MSGFDARTARTPTGYHVSKFDVVPGDPAAIAASVERLMKAPQPAFEPGVREAITHPDATLLQVLRLAVREPALTRAALVGCIALLELAPLIDEEAADG